jgi:hypothetical protein
MEEELDLVWGAGNWESHREDRKANFSSPGTGNHSGPESRLALG